jgi:hypothetical protein
VFKVLYVEPYTVLSYMNLMSILVNWGTVHKFRMAGRPSDKTVDRDGWYLWVLSMELAACHPCGVQDFAMALYFWKLFGSLC